jgi:hypothetical protein
MESFILLVVVLLVAATWALYRVAVVTKETRR